MFSLSAVILTFSRSRNRQQTPKETSFSCQIQDNVTGRENAVQYVRDTQAESASYTPLYRI